MGVLKLFSWLVRHFEDDIISEDCPYETVHNLYLDFNGGIHPAARSKPENSVEQMVADVITYLEHLIDIVNPTELLYIAIDGVAPAAKMKQQRVRRFKSVRETKELNELKLAYGEKVNTKKHKDFNMISPATRFMSLLSSEIQKFLKVHKSGKYKHLKIIFSDASVPGEGEHKVLGHIRQQPLDKNCLIYGLDSDLIFLALSTHRDNVSLIREDNFLKNNHLDLSTDKFPVMNYFIINELRAHMVNILNPYTSLGELEGIKIFGVSKKKNEYEIPDDEIVQLFEKMKELSFFHDENDIYRLIDDYIFICFLVGNDFVPSVQSLTISGNGLEQILRAYKVTVQKKMSFLIEDDHRINVDFFLELLKNLTQTERESLKKQKIKRDRSVKRKAQDKSVPSNYKDARDAYQYIEDKYKDEINAFEDGWEDRYYTYFFHLKESENSHKQRQIDQICEDYIRALQWIARYYFTGCPDWHWFYEHEATPLLSDLVAYVESRGEAINDVTFVENGPVEPYLQLLTILPPQSAHLLPAPYRFIMCNDDSPVIYYYPTEFDFEYYGHKFLWECHPKVPMISPSELIEFIDHYKQKLTMEEKKRNLFGKPLEF
jgi:5'-3' exonuclease